MEALGHDLREPERDNPYNQWMYSMKTSKIFQGELTVEELFMDTWQERALNIAYQLDLAGVPFNSPLRIFEVPEAVLRDALKLGYPRLCGLTLMPDGNMKTSKPSTPSVSVNLSEAAVALLILDAEFHRSHAKLAKVKREIEFLLGEERVLKDRQHQVKATIERIKEKMR